MLTRELLESYGWPDNDLTELAVDAAAALVRSGMAREAALVWLDQVYTQPGRYLGDPALAPLARARLHKGLRAIRCAEEEIEEECERAIACRN